MTDTPDAIPTNLTSIPDFSLYAMSPSGDVFRVVAPERGRTAGLRGKVKPVIHPRGHRWYVQIYDASGKRHRIAVRELLKRTFGVETIS